VRQVNALIEANYKKIQHVISLKDIFKEQKIMMIGMKLVRFINVFFIGCNSKRIQDASISL